MSTEQGNPEKNWLVRSSTRILGPFTVEEVTALLRSKQVSIIDEIRQPSGRWSYVRENKIFLDIVRNIRDELDTMSDKTMTQSMTSGSFTKTAEVNIQDELTPTPFFDRKEFPTPYKDVTHSKERSVGSGSARSYGVSGDRRVREELEKKSKFWRWVTSGLVVIFALVVFGIFTQREKNRNLGFSDLIHQALRYKSLGIYDRAMQYYSKALMMQAPDLEIQIQMAPVLISEDRQTLAGRRILEKALINESAPRAALVEAYLGIAVSYMMDGDLKKAEDTLQKAMGHDPANLSGQLDLAIIELKKGNYEKAKTAFDEIYRKNSTSSFAILGRAMASVESAKVSGDWSSLSRLVQDLKFSISRSGHLRQELSLFLAYIQNERKDMDGFSQALSLFLNEQPGQASSYVHPIFIDWRFSQWDYLEKYCGELYMKQTPTAHLKSLRAICLLEVNRDGEAQKLLQEAQTEAPGDSFVLSSQASYLTKMGMYPEAMTILKLKSLDSLPLRDQLMGQICVATQDWKCAQAAFTALYSKDQRNVEALFGLATVVFRRNERALAYDYVRAGLQAEDNYLPLLELRDKMEAE